MSKLKKLRTRCFFDVSIGEDIVGRIIFELFNDVCPKTCENFKALCTGERGLGKFTGKPLHYKDVAFHRIVKDFIIQSGDFSQGNGKGGESIYGGTFEDESFHFKHEKPFLLSMANRGKNTNGSQFFITLAPAPHLDGVHVVYGHVISGEDTVLKIANQAVDKNSKPLVSVRISNCGELIPQIKSKDSKTKDTKQVSGSEESDSDSDDSSSNSDSDDNDSDSSSSDEGEINDKTTSRKDNKSKNSQGEDNLPVDKVVPESNEPKYFSTVKPEEVPDIPPNRFLMRGAENKEKDDTKMKEKIETKQPGPFDRSYSKRILYTKSGRKIKGRGFVRFRTPSPDRGRSRRSETPPHWKLATQKLKTLKEAIEESQNSQQTDIQYRGRNDNRRFNGRSQRYQRSRSRSPHYNNNRRHDDRRRDYSPEPKRYDRMRGQSPEQINHQKRNRSPSVDADHSFQHNDKSEERSKVIEEGEIDDELIDSSKLSKGNHLLESIRDDRKRVHSPEQNKLHRERSRSASVDTNQIKGSKENISSSKADKNNSAETKDKLNQKHHDRKLSKHGRSPDSRKSPSRSPIRKKHDRNRSRSLSLDNSRAKKQKDNNEDLRAKEKAKINHVDNKITTKDSKLENKKISKRDQSPLLESVKRTKSPDRRIYSRHNRSRSASLDNLSKDTTQENKTNITSSSKAEKNAIKENKVTKITENRDDKRHSPDSKRNHRNRSPSLNRSKHHHQRKRSRSSSFDRNKDGSRKGDIITKKDKIVKDKKEDNNDRRDDRKMVKHYQKSPEPIRNNRKRSKSITPSDNKKSHRNRSRSSSVTNHRRTYEPKDTNNNNENQKLDNGKQEKHIRKSSLDRAENVHSSKKPNSDVVASSSLSSHRHHQSHRQHHHSSHHRDSDERSHQSKHTRHSSRNISPSR